VTRFPVDETHDAGLSSWVPSANARGTDFPVQNLPLGVFRRRGAHDRPRIGVAIGDAIFDLYHAAQENLVTGADSLREACEATTLNALMSLPHAHRLQFRHTLSSLLRSGADASRTQLVSQDDAEMLLPATIGDYTDFYASIHHATNVGKMLRPDSPLLPNYKYVPIGYHGRASSIVVSGTEVHRPSGQAHDDANQPPVFGPTRRLDYELEVGFFVGRSNTMGEAVPIEHAGARLFGLCLLNDWSARDIQTWEYQPLGPFLAKNFSSSISGAGLRARRGGSRPAAIPLRRGRPGRRRHRRPARGAAFQRAHARRGNRAGAPQSLDTRRSLLDPGTAAGPPHLERLQPAAGRPARQRHGVG